MLKTAKTVYQHSKSPLRRFLSVASNEGELGAAFALSQNKRRLEVDPVGEDPGDSFLHRELLGGKSYRKDLTYNNLHHLKERVMQQGHSEDDISRSVQQGLVWPDSEYPREFQTHQGFDPDLQMISQLLLSFQRFNSQPLKRTDTASKEENQYRDHELVKSMVMLGQNFGQHHQRLLPGIDKASGVIQLQDSFSPLIDVNRPQPKTIFGGETFKGVFKGSQEVFKDAFQQGERTGGGYKSPEDSLILAGEHYGPSFLKYVASLRESGVEDVEEYLRQTLQLKLGRDTPLEFSGGMGEEFLDNPELFSDQDNLFEAMKKRQAMLSIPGVLAKVTGQHFMRNELLGKSNSETTEFLEMLNHKMQVVQGRHGKQLSLVSGEKAYFASKMKLLKQAEKKGGDSTKVEELREELQGFYEDTTMEELFGRKKKSPAWKVKDPTLKKFGPEKLTKEFAL